MNDFSPSSVIRENIIYVSTMLQNPPARTACRKSKTSYQINLIWSLKLKTHTELARPKAMKNQDVNFLNTCQLFYDHIVDNKPCNFTISFVSLQHNYATRSTSLQHLNPSSFKINVRTFCPTIIGCYYCNDIPISISKKQSRQQFKRALYQYYFAQY